MERNIHKGHRERMRRRFAEIGFRGWSDHEILEYLLYNVQKQGDTNPLAHRLIEYSAGSIVTLLRNASDSRLADDIEGVNEKTVLFLRSIKAFVDYYRREELRYKPVKLSRDNFMEIVNIVGFLPEREDLLMICLDAFMNVKSIVNITEKCGDKYAATSAEKIIKTATMSGSKNVILVHNHPDGAKLVSLADIEMTLNLDMMLKNIGVSLIDHYVLCGDDIISVKMESMSFNLDEILER